MAEPARQPAATVAALSADYSGDELDAIAELFDRPRLARRRQPPSDAGERVRRAVADAALRALVARRALVLEGEPSRPRVRFLEPHATLLDPFVAAEATIWLRVGRPGGDEARALFVREDLVVEQRVLPGRAIARMTARPRTAARALALAELPLDADAASHRERRPLELTTRSWEAAQRALAAGEPPPPGLAGRALDVLHAGTAVGELHVVHRDAEGALIEHRVAWLAAGALGIWRIEPGPGEPPATLLLVPSTRTAVLAEAAAAVEEALAPPADAAVSRP